MGLFSRSRKSIRQEIAEINHALHLINLDHYDQSTDPGKKSIAKINNAIKIRRIKELEKRRDDLKRKLDRCEIESPEKIAKQDIKELEAQKEIAFNNKDWGNFYRLTGEIYEVQQAKLKLVSTSGTTWHDDAKREIEELKKEYDSIEIKGNAQNVQRMFELKRKIQELENMISFKSPSQGKFWDNIFMLSIVLPILGLIGYVFVWPILVIIFAPLANPSNTGNTLVDTIFPIAWIVGCIGVLLRFFGK